MAPSAAVAEILKRLRRRREELAVSAEQLEAKLILGPGWVARFESGEITPSIDLLLAMLRQLGVAPSVFFAGLKLPGTASTIDRTIYGEADGEDLLVHFRYAKHDASYRVPKATLAQFEGVLKELRDGLSALVADVRTADRAIKTDSVAKAFLKATRIWPFVNPSDLWWFVVYRAYCDPFNHPAKFARLDLPQSWKRTGGWALEEVLVRFYGPYLKSKGINLFIGRGDRKTNLLAQLKVKERLEADKVDVLLSVEKDGEEFCFGVVHVKASFAERRTDDVPMSRALVEAGYCSPLWTMDCKSGPSATPANRGELGVALHGSDDKRSAKRKDIEDDGYFSACFSYNANTVPTPTSQKTTARIIVCNFRNPADAFSKFVVAQSKRVITG